jgi:hypothetical protein
MPRRKVLSGFSGQLLAFGAGVAVGANWPRAGNFVGFILQRLGFELTGLALWMWDPEKSISNSPETTPVMKLESKRSARAFGIQEGNPRQKKGGNAARRAHRMQLAQDIARKPFKEPADASEEAVLASSLNEADKVGSSDASINAGIAHPPRSQANSRAVRTVRKKAKETVAKPRRTSQTARRVKKVGPFLPSLLPADTSLN